MATIQVKKRKGISKMSIHGELTLSNVSSLKTSLLKAFQRSNDIELNLQSVTRLDIAGLQLVCASCKYAQKQAKILNRIGDLSEEAASFLREGEYVKGTDCPVNPGIECLIRTGEKS